jgi:peptidylprolyl isomerase
MISIKSLFFGMKKLSRNEWIAVFIAIGFVGYTLFGSTINNVFNSQKVMSEENTAAVPSAGDRKEVMTNDLTSGTGAVAEKGKLITVHYVLSLEDGTVIQNSRDFGQPFKFVLGAGQVIPGWEIGFNGMKVGGKRTIIIPPEFGYGAQQAGPIPPNSTLVFTVELLGVEDAPRQ